MANNLAAWLDFALQQMAAESYLQDIDLNTPLQVRSRLLLGANNVVGTNPTDPILNGKTRFTNVLADRFLERYRILDHHANDATGFSATLLFDTQTSSYTLSFRSVEYQNESDGGDWHRDGLPGAAGEIAGTGFALAQLVSMERYYRDLKTSGLLPQDAVLNVTGYSLGGHLATIFTELHASDLTHTYTFNGAGRGRMIGGTEGLTEADRILEMLQDAEARLAAIDPSWFVSGSPGNIYGDERYRDARQDTILAYHSTSSFLPPGEARAGSGFEKITQLVGQATHDDSPLVANSGIHAAPTTVFIEDQPNVDELGGLFAQSGSFGTTHSITLLVDSLALMELFQDVDGTLDQPAIERIFAAASSQAASGFVGVSGIAEGNSLEAALDALGTIVVPDYTPTPFGRQTNDFGDLGLRNQFYANLQQVKRAIDGHSYQIANLAALSSSEIAAAARGNDATGLAYRYALQELNPFAVVGVDYTAHNPGGMGGGPLDLYDVQTGQGTWTEAALSDRAELLAERLNYSLANGTPVDRSATLYVDHTTNFDNERNASATEVVMFGDSAGGDMVGRSGNDHVYGGGGDDVISGLSGYDYLEGGQGDDYLDGGDHGDVLLGQTGVDTLIGGGGNDRLNGGLGDDRLEGGVGSDQYAYVTDQGQDRIKDIDHQGSIVFDRQVLVGGIRKEGDPEHTYRSPDGRFTFVKHGADLVINGTLTIEDFDAATGSLGLKLTDSGDLQSGDLPDIDYGSPDPTTTRTLVGTEGNDLLDLAGGGARYAASFHGLGGNDYLSSSSPFGTDQMFGGVGSDALAGGMDHDRLHGDAGDDGLFGGAEQDVLYGGEGRDLLIGDWVSGVLSTPGADYLDGGAGDDTLHGQDADDILSGGDGDDELYGDDSPNNLLGQAFDNPSPRRVGDDYLDGGVGNDLLAAGLGDDVLYGQAGHDVLYGDNSLAGDLRVWQGNSDPHLFDGFTVGVAPGARQVFFSPDGGADYLDGGDGDDYLQGDGGDDILLGGAGADQLWGDDAQVAAVQEGQDWLEGGAGNDQLVGGGGEDALFGGDDDDVLVGDYPNNAILGFDDTLDGGAGHDELHGGGGADVLDGGSGNDRLFGQGGHDSLYGGEGDDIGLGGDGDDVLVGEEGNDRLDGEAGDDLVFGDEGHDILFGGAGRDSLDGGDGDDILIAGDGDDVLAGGAGHDELQGGAGADRLSGEAGDDRLFGQDGNDTLFGDEGHDLLRGEADDDVLFGGAGVDRLFGDDGADRLYGDEGADVLLGGAGTDVLEGGQGDDHLEGGQGADTYLFRLGDGNDTVIDATGEGNRVRFGLGITPQDLTLGSASGALVVRVGSIGGSLTINGFNPADASAPSDVAQYEFADGTVLSHADLVARGFAFSGTRGNDVLVGATNGLNQMAGGEGEDTYVVNQPTDRIVEFSGGGTDTVRTSVDFTLPDHVENLLAVSSEGSSAGPMRLTGNGLGNVIQALSGVAVDNLLEGLGGHDLLSGYDGDDVLDGGTGDDVLVGGSGSDTYVFGAGDGHDVVIEQSVPGIDVDTVRFRPGVAPGDVRVRLVDNLQTGRLDLAVELIPTGDRLTLPHGTAEQMVFADGTVWDAAAIDAKTEGLTRAASPAGTALTGTHYRDTLIGSDGNDFLDGRGEADTMIGGNGNDFYVVDHVGDVVAESAGHGRDTVQSSIDYTLPAHVENLELNLFAFQGPAPVLGVGNAGANDLRGNFLDNILQGGAGDDRLWGGFRDAGGGPGNDELFGGAGDDTFFYTGPTEGIDTLYDTALPGEGNHLVFGGQIRPEDLAITDAPGTLRIDVGSAGGAVVLAGYDPTGVHGSRVVDYVEFGRGVGFEKQGFEIELAELQDVTHGTAGVDVLIGTTGVDVLQGEAGDDQLAGGPGNDILSGGMGNDTYRFQLGDGVDLIDDLALPAEGNRVVFGAGITPDSLAVEANGAGSDALVTLHVGSNGDAIQFLGFQPSDPFSPRAVETFEFADGTITTFDELFMHGTEVRGTHADDGELFGTFANDTLSGFGGSDSLSGDLGDDTLIGGPGNDHLIGGPGSDTYVYNHGDGLDEVYDEVDRFQNPSDHNRVLFGPGITPADLTWSDREGSLFISVGTDGNGLNLGPYADVLPFGVTTLEFADGTKLNTEAIIESVVNSGVRTVTGGEGDNLLVGGQGADQLIGGSGPNLMLGGEGDDRLTGGAGSNRMFGGSGNDVLQGGSGPNIMHGGSGANVLIAGSGSNTFLIDPSGAVNTIRLSAAPVPGHNQVQFGGAYDQVNPSLGLGSLLIRYGSEGGELHLEGFDPSDAYNNPGIDTFVFDDRVLTYRDLIDLGFDLSGSDTADLLTGTSATDRMLGLDGDDELSAGDGEDRLAGGRGNDLLIGGAGHDTYVFHLGDGFDTIRDAAVGDERNAIQFGAGITRADLMLTEDQVARTLTIAVGDDGDAIRLADFDITGANGSDVVKSLMFADGTAVTLHDLLGRGALVGTDGDDLIMGTAASDTVDAKAGHDTIVAGEGDDTLLGGEGHDLVDGGGGADTMIGGAGDDMYSVDERGDQVIESAHEGTDTVHSAITYALGPHVENLTLLGDAAIGGTGNDAGNVLLGNGADNFLVGGRGDDHLDGAAGSDVLAGGVGDDTYEVDRPEDVVTELPNEGMDTVYSWVTWTLGDHVENLTLVGSEAVNGIGNALDNRLIGNAGENSLAGKSGNDVYVVGTGDRVVEEAEGGTDTVESSVSWTLGSHVENLVLTGTTRITGSGNHLHNLLAGNEGGNILHGRSGNDTIDGRGGEDSLFGGSGNDRLLGGAGDDLLSGGSGHDRLEGADGDDRLDGGSGDDLLFGGVGDDRLIGGSGADRLVGGPGRDLLQGGAGSDQYLFAWGDEQDTIIESAGNMDRLTFSSDIEPLDLMLSRSADDLRIALYGSHDQVTISDWYGGAGNQLEAISAGNGWQLVNNQVDQLIQAMAAFSQQSGLSWEDAIAQRPEDVQAVLAASWQ